MPNIETHGIRSEEAIANLRNLIFETIRRISVELLLEVVVTSIPDECVDVALRPQPFLRIIGSAEDKEKISKIVQCLKPLKIDIEVLTIDSFIPAEGSFR